LRAPHATPDEGVGATLDFAIIDCSDIIDCMASITVRNVPESTKRKLKIRAATRGRSMEEEVREILNNAVQAAPSKHVNLGEVIHRRFARLGGVDLEPLPREPVRDPDWLKDWKE
jgi:antitoxin FitA